MTAFFAAGSTGPVSDTGPALVIGIAGGIWRCSGVSKMRHTAECAPDPITGWRRIGAVPSVPAGTARVLLDKSPLTAMAVREWPNGHSGRLPLGGAC